MQVYKTFFAIVRRNLGMVIMYGCIFLAISAMLSVVMPGQTTPQFEDTKVPVTVIDRDQSVLSTALTEYLYERQKPAPLADDDTAMQDALYRRNTEYILFLPQGFGDALLQGDLPLLDTVQVPGSYSAAYVDSQLQGYLNTLRAYLAAGYAPQDAATHTHDDLQAQVSVTLSQGAVKSVPSVYYFFQFLCYGLSMVMIFGMSPVLLAFNRKEISVRLNASALPLRRRNLELGRASLTFAGIAFAVFLLAALVMYRAQMLSIGIALCILNGLAFLVFSTALALLVGMVSKNSNMISAIANVVVLAMCFLGGVYVPVTLLSPGMQSAARLIPTFWYIQAVDGALEYAAAGTSLSAVWQGIGMQLLFALALFSASVLISRQKQRIA